ncbi:DUF3772 domain-containing protein [uncultured Roseobacter sp.]|uniref:DUF3772 domain-containing protein n=1 Tax=uncultured Roseobacter sp. TaxID=114847 RepID=UPI00262007FF|nr:DUF3772 domain-containing protein [uncultured Roseobacter sp.]
MTLRFRRLACRHIALVGVLLLVLSLAGIAAAQDDLSDFRMSIEDRRAQLTLIETELTVPGTTRLVDLRARVRDILQDAQDTLGPVVSQRDRLRAELEALGPPPEEGQPDEAADLAAERARISAAFTAYDAAIRQAELNVATANRLLEDIANARRDRFYESVFRAGPSPLDPAVIAGGIGGFVQGIADGLRWARQDVKDRDLQNSLFSDIAILASALVLALLMFLPARRKLNRLTLKYMRSNAPTPSRRVLIAGIRTVARIVPGVIGGLIVYEALKLTELIRPGVVGDEAIAGAIWLTFLALITVDGAARAVFFRSVDGWEITQIGPYKAYLARFSLMLVTALLGADAILRAGAALLGAPQETALLQSAVVAGLLAAALVFFTRKTWTTEFLRTPTADQDPSPDREKVRASVARISITGLLIALVIVAATLIGYVALGYFLATRVFFIAGLAAAMWCVRGVLREAILTLSNRVMPAAEDAPEGDEAEEDGKPGNLLQFWALLALELLVLTAFIAPAALILGASFSDVRDTALDAFFGFQVGSVTISLADLLAGVTVFVVLLGVTRFIQQTVEKRLFPHTRIDPGVQHSFRTLIGYGGLVIAGLAAIGAIGADLSNLAIVAGALSVGIGFGLQSIVSNFVSGLILLFERPVKVGDWIVVPSGEGFVRRISVRSTEIETFDRSSVIVPNSELIAGTVTNLTLDNKMGRVVVPVGVSYDSDPERVMEILYEIANAHPKILKNPGPMVAFTALGESSLDFELRGFIRDVMLGAIIRTEVRVQIVKRLRQEGIDIPFPQRVIHMEKPDDPPETKPA